MGWQRGRDRRLCGPEDLEKRDLLSATSPVGGLSRGSSAPVEHVRIESLGGEHGIGRVNGVETRLRGLDVLTLDVDSRIAAQVIVPNQYDVFGDHHLSSAVEGDCASARPDELKIVYAVGEAGLISFATGRPWASVEEQSLTNYWALAGSEYSANASYRESFVIVMYKGVVIREAFAPEGSAATLDITLDKQLLDGLAAQARVRLSASVADGSWTFQFHTGGGPFATGELRVTDGLTQQQFLIAGGGDGIYRHDQPGRGYNVGEIALYDHQLVGFGLDHEDSWVDPDQNAKLESFLTGATSLTAPALWYVIFVDENGFKNFRDDSYRPGMAEVAAKLTNQFCISFDDCHYRSGGIIVGFGSEILFQEWSPTERGLDATVTIAKSRFDSGCSLDEVRQHAKDKRLSLNTIGTEARLNLLGESLITPVTKQAIDERVDRLFRAINVHPALVLSGFDHGLDSGDNILAFGDAAISASPALDQFDAFVAGGDIDLTVALRKAVGYAVVQRLVDGGTDSNTYHGLTFPKVLLDILDTDPQTSVDSSATVYRGLRTPTEPERALSSDASSSQTELGNDRETLKGTALTDERVRLRDTALEMLSKKVAYNNYTEASIGRETIDDGLGHTYTLAKILKDDFTGLVQYGFTSPGLDPIIVFRGTDIGQIFGPDGVADAAPTGIGTTQFNSDVGEADLNWLRSIGAKGVIITGHSLGGPLAQMLAVYLSKREFMVDSLVTFNSPGLLETQLVGANLNYIKLVTHYIARGDIVSTARHVYVPGNVVFASHAFTPDVLRLHLDPFLSQPEWTLREGTLEELQSPVFAAGIVTRLAVNQVLTSNNVQMPAMAGMLVEFLTQAVLNSLGTKTLQDLGDNPGSIILQQPGPIVYQPPSYPADDPTGITGIDASTTSAPHEPGPNISFAEKATDAAFSSLFDQFVRPAVNRIELNLLGSNPDPIIASVADLAISELTKSAKGFLEQQLLKAGAADLIDDVAGWASGVVGAIPGVAEIVGGVNSGLNAISSVNAALHSLVPSIPLLPTGFDPITFFITVGLDVYNYFHSQSVAAKARRLAESTWRDTMISVTVGNWWASAADMSDPAAQAVFDQFQSDIANPDSKNRGDRQYHAELDAVQVASAQMINGSFHLVGVSEPPAGPQESFERIASQQTFGVVQGAFDIAAQTRIRKSGDDVVRVDVGHSSPTNAERLATERDIINSRQEQIRRRMRVNATP